MAGQVRVLRRRIRTASRRRRSPRRWSWSPPAASPRPRSGWRRPCRTPGHHRRAHGAGVQRDASTTRCCTPRRAVRRAGVLLITSDRGLAGGYNANAIRTAEQLIARLRADGKEVVLYVVGRKGVGVLPVPQPADRGELDRLLRAAVASPTPGEIGEHADRGVRRRRRRRDGGATHRSRRTAVLGRRRAAHRAHPVQVADDPDRRWRSFLAPMQVEERRATSRAAAGVRVRAGGRGAARRAAAEVHQHADLRGVAGLGGERVGVPAAGDEERHGQRGRHDQEATRAR